MAATDVHRSFPSAHHLTEFPYEPPPPSSSWPFHNSGQQRPWSSLRDPGGDSRNADPRYMSDRSSDQRPSLPAQAPRAPSASKSIHQHAHPSTSSAAPSQRQAFELPPLPHVSATPVGSFAPSRSRLASVSSILNLTDDDDGQHGRRRKLSELETSAGPAPTLHPYQNPRGNSPQLAPGQPRRMLTPRSPSLHRAASMGSLNQPATGTINAQHSPFLLSPRARTYAVQPGVSGAPPLPTPSAAVRSHFGAVAPSEGAPRTSPGVVHASEQASASASPGSSYSGNSQVDQMSPGASYAPGPAYSTAEDASAARAGGIPISSSAGQNVYQMMTLETTSGTVQLPVDVQAASRVADEKRRRNAGASARFRQRRKEKEKEASTTISRLEQQVKDALDGRDFYKHDRDQLAHALLQTPGGDRHFPRPPSPRPRRLSTHYLAPRGSIGSAFDLQDERPSSAEGERNVRRRTSMMSLPRPPPPLAIQSASSGPGTPYQTGYAPSYARPLSPTQHLHHHPPELAMLPSPMSRAAMLTHAPRLSSMPGSQQQHPFPHQLPPSATSGVPLPPQLMQAPPQTGPWNPYAAERRSQGPPGPPRDSR